MKLGTRCVALLALCLVSPMAHAKKDKKKKKKDEVEAPLVGWNRSEGWPGDCYYPPQWDQLPATDRKIARSEALDAMLSQWQGGRDDGISFDEELTTDVETVLLGRPEAIEQVAADNLARCQAVMAGGDKGEWEQWLKSLPAKLTEGECRQPLDYTMFDYLSIGTGWQRPLSICQGETVRISGTVKDRYRVTEDGPWINVEGDPDQPAVGTDLPCNVEGCFVGQLIMKFEADSGWTKVMPVGAELIFTAPEHGTISYRINDDTFFDNTWYKSRGIEDHTAIEVSPAQ